MCPHALRVCVSVAVGVAVAGTHLIALEGNDGVLSCPAVWQELRSAWYMSCSGMCCHPREDVFHVCAGIALPRRSLSACPAFSVSLHLSISISLSLPLDLSRALQILWHFFSLQGGRKKILHGGNMSMHLWVAVLPFPLTHCPLTTVSCHMPKVTSVRMSASCKTKMKTCWFYLPPQVL